MKLNSATLSSGASGEPGSVDVISDRPHSPAVAIALVLIRVYKLTISPLFPGACRFLPSCSDYAAQAVRVHGVARGTWLAARRLSRCHPFCAGGHDPVPPRG